MRSERLRPVQIAAQVLFLGLLCGWLVVGRAGQGAAKPAEKPLDLNRATVEELQRLPGIGPSTARAIVRFREKSGPFRRVEDLLAIRGITRKKLEKLRPCVTVAPPRSDPQASVATGRNGTAHSGW